MPTVPACITECLLTLVLDVTWKDLGIDFTKRNTWNALEPKDKGNGEVIDHIIYNRQNMKVLDGEIIEMEKPLSDHKPVWTLLEVK
jgi:maltose 6'-phosphate phosphatase